MDALTSQNLLGIGDNVIGTTRGTGDAEKYYRYNKDVRESTSNVLDDDGESQVSYEYDDYGKTEVKGSKDFYNEICYTGGIYDEGTGLYYLNARYYDPETLHLYAYCKNNPVSYTDPTGHWFLAAIKVASKLAKPAVKYGKKAAKYAKKGFKKAKKKVKKAYKKYNVPYKEDTLRRNTRNSLDRQRLKRRTKRRRKKRLVSQRRNQRKRRNQENKIFVLLRIH